MNKPYKINGNFIWIISETDISKCEYSVLTLPKNEPFGILFINNGNIKTNDFEGFVEKILSNNLKLFSTWGRQASEFENIVDHIDVGRHLKNPLVNTLDVVTTAHSEEDLKDVLDFSLIKTWESPIFYNRVVIIYGNDDGGTMFKQISAEIKDLNELWCDLGINWRKNVKEYLEDLASLEFQKKAWLDRTDPQLCWDWGEAILGYFEDLLLSDSSGGLAFHLRAGALTPDEASILKPFNELFSTYVDNSPDCPTDEEYEKIIADPEWIKITETAKEILTKIDFEKVPQSLECSL